MQEKILLKHTPYVPYDSNVFTYVQSEGGMRQVSLKLQFIFHLLIARV
jgi:hypothetical protein